MSGNRQGSDSVRPPAFQFYPTDYLGSQRVQMMTLEEEGAYCRLLWSCWQHGSIPSDPALAARLVGKGCSTTVAATVLPMFEIACGEGRVTHDRLERERQKQSEWREKSAQGGRKSAEMRKGGSRVVQPPCQPNGNIPSLSPSLSSVAERESTLAERPSLSEILTKAQFIGLAEWKARDWFNEMESCGWLDHNHRPVLKWQPLLDRVKSKWEADGRPSGPPSSRNGSGVQAVRKGPNI